jgi:hypothetical protein
MALTILDVLVWCLKYSHRASIFCNQNNIIMKSFKLMMACADSTTDIGLIAF